MVASLGELREEWIELAEQADNVFLTWEWLSTWWRHFGAGRSLCIVACRSAGGQMRAILPLYRYARRPLRVVRYLGHGASDQLGPVCAPEDRLRTARAIRRALRLLEADLMLADHHPADESWSALCGGRLLATVGAPVLRREGRSWQQILGGCSRNLRHQVGKRERKLLREHGLSIGFVLAVHAIRSAVEDGVRGTASCAVRSRSSTASRTRTAASRASPSRAGVAGVWRWPPERRSPRRCSIAAGGA